MKILITCLVIFSLQLNEGSAQQTKATAKAPLVLVDTFMTDLKCLLLAPQKIESIDVYKDTSAIKLYGDKGRNGVVVVHTKGEVSLLRLKGLFDRYDFPDSLRNYRVCINGVIVDKPELILVDESEVESFGTFNRTDWYIFKEPRSEMLINISSKRKKPEPVIQY